MLFQLAQGHHGTDGELLVGFFHLVQSQFAQINGGIDAAGTQPQPHHAADDTVSPGLIQLIRFFQTLRSHIVLNGFHQ